MQSNFIWEGRREKIINKGDWEGKITGIERNPVNCNIHLETRIEKRWSVVIDTGDYS